jgi:signal transduction histidine kinase/ActR/RegA family two-component response regulator
MDELFPQSVADEFRRRDESLLQKPGAHAYEASIQHVDGNQHDVIFHKATFANMHGRVAGLMVAILDVTRENRLEEQLRHIQKMDAIGRLAGGISHDFNNLMAAIMVNTDMVLADIGESHPLRPDIEAVRRAADRAAALTRQLLAFSRKQVMYPKVVDLNTVVVDMHRILRRVIGENIDLVIEADDALRPVKVDPVQIGQVVMNLAINARDAMPDGGRLEIKTQNYDFSDAEAAAYADLSPGPYVLLSVRDTGGGMDEHVRNHVFEPFFTTKEEGKGTGLGLATVYGIVRQSDGHIFVLSEVGEGALFKIFLPETRDPAMQDHVVPRQMHVRGGGETVLIAEDENMVRQPAAEVLRKYGYTVLEASDGVEALETVKNHQGGIHLLLSDAVMPRMNGAELASQVRALRPETRLVFMSGHPDNTLVRLGLDGDDILFIQKPFSMDELVHRVRRVLDGDVDSSSDL